MTELKKKIRFIINPKSGIGRQKKIETLILSHVDETMFESEICYTQAKAHATILAQDAVRMNYAAAVAVGGDGTINEVAQGLLHSNTAMGIIPAGSGNGLARFLKISIRTKKALNIINRFHIKTIDTGLINGHTFVSIAGLGYDAHVAELFAKSINRGFWAYARICFTEYIKFNPRRFKISADGKTLKRNAFMVSFANSDQFGFNARISPRAIIDDGFIDLCIVRKPRIYYAAFVIPFIFMGLIDKTPFVRVIRAKDIRVVQLRNNAAHIDGDDIRLGKKISVQVVPQSLRVVC